MTEILKKSVCSIQKADPCSGILCIICAIFMPAVVLVVGGFSAI